MSFPHVDPEHLAAALKAAKAAGAVLAAGVSAIVAQAFDVAILDGLSNLGIVAVLAVLAFRYTFRQLEGYRDDLKAAHDRNAKLESDLHAAGRASADRDAEIRELTEYGHRLRLFLIAAGADTAELPEAPEIKGPEDDDH